jgi:hypothetical protein
MPVDETKNRQKRFATSSHHPTQATDAATKSFCQPDKPRRRWSLETYARQMPMGTQAGRKPHSEANLNRDHSEIGLAIASDSKAIPGSDMIQKGQDGWRPI